MRNKINISPCFPFCSKVPKEVRDYHERYERINNILDENPAILETVHADLSRACSPVGRQSTFSTEQFLRMIVVMAIEGDSFRKCFSPQLHQDIFGQDDGFYGA